MGHRRTSFLNWLVTVAGIAIFAVVLYQGATRYYAEHGLPRWYHSWHTQHYGVRSLGPEDTRQTIQEARDEYAKIKARRIYPR